MRPTPDEVIAGIRTMLKQDIGPQLPASAQLQLKRVIAVLRDGRWNESGFDVLRENAQFALAAASFAARLDLMADLPEALMQLAGPLREAAGAASDTVPTSFACANEINQQLRAALVACLEAVRDRNVVALDDICMDIGATFTALRAE